MIIRLVACKVGRSYKNFSINNTIIWAKSLVIEDIPYLPEEEILDHIIVRPGHPEVYCFMLPPDEFDSEEHFAQLFYALTQRLSQIKEVSEKMLSRIEEEKESREKAASARKSRRESMQKFVENISTSELIALEKDEVEKNLLMIYKVRQLRGENKLLMNILEKNRVLDEKDGI